MKFCANLVILRQLRKPFRTFLSFYSELFYYFTPNFLTISLRTFLFLPAGDRSGREGRRLLLFDKRRAGEVFATAVTCQRTYTASASERRTPNRHMLPYFGTFSVRERQRQPAIRVARWCRLRRALPNPWLLIAFNGCAT